MSRRDKGRTIDGVILLDKSPGMSSNLALQKVKRLLNARKAGHTGSLDPLATGLLPICLGEATKWSAFLLDDDKRYWVKVRLGQTTTTGDREGETLEERPVPTLTETVVEQILDRFRGPIDQYPPMFSALKFQGRRLYELARQGVEVERAARRVTVHLLKLQAFSGDFLELDVHCSKGTYIRSLAVDIGEAIGCGAHVEELRRTAVGPFRVAESLGLAQLEVLSEEERLARVRPVDCLLLGLPKISLGDSQTHFIRRGQAVLVPKVSTGGLVRLYSRQLGFLGVGEVNDEGLIAPRRLCRAPVAITSDSQEVADVA